MALQSKASSFLGLPSMLPELHVISAPLLYARQNKSRWFIHAHSIQMCHLLYICSMYFYVYYIAFYPSPAHIFLFLHSFDLSSNSLFFPGWLRPCIYNSSNTSPGWAVLTSHNPWQTTIGWPTQWKRTPYIICTYRKLSGTSFSIWPL